MAKHIGVVNIIKLLLIFVTLIDLATCLTKNQCLNKAKGFTDSYKNVNINLEFKQDAVNLFKHCIVDFFKFKMLPHPQDTVMDNYIKFDPNAFPTFAENEWAEYGPLTDDFKGMADAIELFFTKYGKWEKIVNDAFFKREGDNGFIICKNLLFVVAARYAYYTNVLYQVSSQNQNEKITLCKKRENTYILPDNVCFPENVGSLTCTSDADVGLIGEKAGETVARYNEHIQNLNCRGENCNSDTMMDNNMYAYSLELATPEMFVSDNEDINTRNKQLIDALKITDSMPKMQQFDITQAALQSARHNDKKFYDDILKVLDNTEVKEASQNLFNMVTNGNENQLKEYSELVKDIGVCIYGDEQTKNEIKEYKKDFDDALEKIREALLKASGSYHSFGALRTIVVASQMKNEQMVERLSLNDYIASAIENVGYAKDKITSCNKEHEQCITDASKYIWRVLACLYPAERIFLKVYEEAPVVEFDIRKARDFVAELYQVYMKPKKQLPGLYLSKYDYDERKKESKGKDTKKILKSGYNLMTTYLGCRKKEECIKKLQNACEEFTKAMIVKLGSIIVVQGRECERRNIIVLKSINKEYFNYVTKTINLIADEFKDFQNKRKGCFDCKIL